MEQRVPTNESLVCHSWTTWRAEPNTTWCRISTTALHQTWHGAAWTFIPLTTALHQTWHGAAWAFITLSTALQQTLPAANWCAASTFIPAWVLTNIQFQVCHATSLHLLLLSSPIFALLCWSILSTWQNQHKSRWSTQYGNNSRSISLHPFTSAHFSLCPMGLYRKGVVTILSGPATQTEWEMDRSEQTLHLQHLHYFFRIS